MAPPQKKLYYFESIQIFLLYENCHDLLGDNFLAEGSSQRGTQFRTLSLQLLGELMT